MEEGEASLCSFDRVARLPVGAFTPSLANHEEYFTRAVPNI